MQSRLGPFLKGFAGALVGALLLMGALHLYQDHQALHQLAEFINLHAEKIAKLP